MNATEFELLSELEDEFEQEAMDLKPLFSRRRAGAQHLGGEAWRALELPPLPGVPIPGTIHRLVCPAGCPPLAAVQCVPIVRQAIFEAINLANNAADKLAAPTTIEPSKRDPKTDKVAIQTADFFRAFFCHDPSRPVPWDSNKPSGVSVAKRFRAVAKNLGGPEARRITFRCNFGAQCAGDVAFSNQNNDPNAITLCGPFWTPPAGMPGLSNEGFRGGTIIHEMLHILYTNFFHHAGHPSGDPEFRRDNAHCYKAFALRVGGYGRDPNAVARCRARNA
jgi:Lysine-specific metallo-endopeptidase